jgi:hypothetical protein
MLPYGVQMLQYWQGPIALGLSAAVLSFAPHFLPAVAGLPFIGLVLSCAAFALAWVLSYAIRAVLDLAYRKGISYADVYGRFYGALLPVADPLVPVERYTLDATPISK